MKSSQKQCNEARIKNADRTTEMLKDIKYLFSKYFKACDTKAVFIVLDDRVLTMLSLVDTGTSVIC